jgi:hypothetical protein
MSYEIQYSNTASAETIKKALKDCKDWLGNAQYKKVCNILKADQGQTPTHLIRVGLMMQGIQGYPAQAMIDTYWSPQMQLNF